MKSASNVLNSHPLPHQQFSSRIAFADDCDDNHTIGQIRLKSKTNSKSTTRLPPIARYDSPLIQGIKSIANLFENTVENSISNERTLSPMTGVDRMDPNVRIKRLEENLKFVKEDCQHILEALHRELEELKIQNRGIVLQIYCTCILY